MRGYYWAGTIAGPDLKKLCGRKLWFFIDFLGCISLFGLAFFVERDLGVLLLWVAAGPPRKFMCPRLMWIKVASMHGNVMDFMIRGRLTRILGRFRAQGSTLTRNVSRLHGSKNLLQRGILYRHEKILLREGRLQAQTQENYVGESEGFSLISRDASICSGWLFFVERELGVLLLWIAAGQFRQFICQ